MSFASIIAFLSLLQAFSVPQPTIDKIHDILIPPIAVQPPQTNYVPVIQTPIVENQPVYFGSTPATVINTPTPVEPVPVIVLKPMTPNWTIQATFMNGATGIEKSTFSKSENIRVELWISNKKGAYEKKKVDIASNDPDVPAFSTNAPGQSSFFTVAPHNGYYGNAETIGTFDFTFTVEDVSLTKQITITE